MFRRLWWIGVGAGLVWFLDPEHGQERRAQAWDKLEGFFGGDPGASRPTSMTDETRDPLREAAAG